MSKIDSLVQTNFSYLNEFGIDKNQMIPLNVEEIVSPTSICNFENFLKEKSMILSQNSRLEICKEFSDTTSSDDQSESFYDQSESFYNQLNSIYDPKPSIKELNKMMSTTDIFQFQSQIKANPIFENDQNVLDYNLNGCLQNQNYSQTNINDVYLDDEI